MRRILMILSLAIITTTLISCASPVKRVAPESDFIFVGTIVLPRSSTIDAEDVKTLAVVRVDKVLDGSNTLINQMGQLITVKLKKPNSAKKGQQRVFFTNSWYFGESIGVIEVASMDGRDSRKVVKIKSEIEQAQEQSKKRTLRSLISQSRLIISGKVINIRKFEEMPAIASEHDPDWYEAEINVDKVLKGNIEKSTVTILFANSNDVMWFKSPKYEKDVQGIWLLRPFVFKKQELKYLTTIAPDEFRFKSEEEQILNLIKK